MEIHAEFLYQPYGRPLLKAFLLYGLHYQRSAGLLSEMSGLAMH